MGKFTGDFKFDANIDSYYDVGGQLPEYLKKLAEGYFYKEEEDKKSLCTVEGVEQRKKYIREAFVSAIGGLDFLRTPLNPVVTGEIVREGYRIKNVIFESLPEFYITANLYIPDGYKEPMPAILFACGHSREGKADPEFQEAAIESVLNGFVVLVVDPVGQGERLQYLSNRGETEFYCTKEHIYAGLQCSLTGSSLARYMIWDLIRSIDYLETLDFVDKSKIGMFGTSGGGMQTIYMMMCDSRIKVAAPTCYITSREEYMKTGQSQDEEQIVKGSIMNGINYDDFITAFAPNPVLINCAEYDFFCIEGSFRSYDRTKRVYSIYNREDKVEISVSKLRHGLGGDLRRAAIGFIKKHLLNSPMVQVDNLDAMVIDSELLNCTRSGQVALDIQESKSIFDLNFERFKRTRYVDTNDLKEIRRRIKKVLNFPQNIDERGPVLYPRIINEGIINNIYMQKLFFFSEKDICVTGIFMRKENCTKNHCTIFVSENSTKDIIEKEKTLHTLLEEGSVFVFDPRGTGAAMSRNVKSNTSECSYGVLSDNERKLNSDAIMMGTTLCTFRVFDILRAYDYVIGRTDCKTASFAGDGIGVLYTLLASALILDPVKVYTTNEMESFEKIVSSKYYKTSPKYNIPGILCEFDIPLLKKLLPSVEI